MKLNCLNSIVDLETGKPPQLTSDEIDTKVTGANFNLKAKCPNFYKVIKEVFGCDGEMISWVQRAFGYCLIWLRQYNQIRDHHTLGMRPSATETLLEKAKISGTEKLG